MIEIKRTTKILKLVIKSKLAVTNEFKMALGYSVFSGVTLPSRSVKTFLILEGSEENHFEFKKSLILSWFSVCNLKKMVERAVQI